MSRMLGILGYCSLLLENTSPFLRQTANEQTRFLEPVNKSEFKIKSLCPQYLFVLQLKNSQIIKKLSFQNKATQSSVSL